MEPIVLDRIPFELDVAALGKRLRLREGRPEVAELRGLAAEGQEIARPMAYCRLAFVEDKGEDWVIVDGERLTSRVLRVNLEKAHRVFLYVATCGQEMEEWAVSFDDLLRRFWADAIAEAALRAATTHLHRHLTEHFQPGTTARMTPGSLADWPLAEQRPLFRLLGDVEGAIGVRLTESLLMIPRKSVSVLEYPTEERFESCQLCPREKCPGRRASYESRLYDEKYRLVV